ncbi:MAG: HemY protein [Thiomicrorhabdus sp.]|nr:MAG: HemY protein [Thiomicrorhabdus sp.]
MRLIIIWAVVFLVGTSLATLMLYDNGQVSMVWNDWVIETSLTFLLGLLITIFIVGYLLVRLVLNLWSIPLVWRRRRRLRQYSKAESSMAKGMVALEYGDWHKAEKELIKSAKNSEAGLVHYLSAAKMAHNQKAYDRRDRYLSQAREAYIDETITIGLVEARLLTESQPEVALLILEALYEQAPKYVTVLAEFALALRQLKLWDRLAKLFPELKRRNAFDKPALAELEQQILAGQLALAQEDALLETLWNKLTSKQKLTPAILTEYIEQKMSRGGQEGLVTLIEKALKKQWSDRLVYQYGRLNSSEALAKLQVAEKWLKGQEDNPVLLLSLGRIAGAAQLWGRSQAYLKSSLKIQPEIETFHALAQCYEAEGQDNQAALIYKEAILKLENVESNAFKSSP